MRGLSLRRKLCLSSASAPEAGMEKRKAAKRGCAPPLFFLLVYG